MTTKGENERIREVESKMGRMEVRMDEIVIPELKSTRKILDENMAGIKLAQLLNSRIVSVVLAGLVAAGIYFAVKTSGLDI